MKNITSARLTLALALGAVASIAAISPALPQARRLEIKALSSRPDMVSGGDALIEVTSPDGRPNLTLNGAPVSAPLEAAQTPGAYRVLVTGLANGANTVAASAGGARASLKLTNYPIAGPILSGPHMKPYECRTSESGLGAPLDADCSARQKIEYFYRASDRTFKPLDNPTGARPADIVTTTTIDGKTVPYIVRVDSGTINRTIYRIAMLDDPRAGQPFRPGAGWNGRLAVTFGGGGGNSYNQGVNNARAPLDDRFLSRGFAHVVDTELVNALHGNNPLQGETLMMVKEYFIEHYGVPKWTVGAGGSGGAIQQMVLTQNYPGLLDGLQPQIAFPDSSLHTPDCSLFENFWRTGDGAKWSQAKRTAIEGFAPGACRGWDGGFGGMTRSDNKAGCGLNDLSPVYDKVTNPKGVRCNIMEMRVNVVGRDPKTGYARRAQDNVGVQYGLVSLNKGDLTVDEFLDFNDKVGGVDADGVFTHARTVGDPIALRRTYEAGLMEEGKGGLSLVPIINWRNYTDLQGDVHTRERDFTIRERLKKGNGRFDNQVIWVAAAPARGGGGGGGRGGGGRGGPAPAGAPAPQPAAPQAATVDLASLSIDAITKWLDAIVADPAPLTTDKVVRHKPPEATDAYWDASGRKIAETATFDGDTGFNRAYPVHSEPWLMAGAPLINDILKCQLKRIDMKDYKVPFTKAQEARLRAIFPGGVCDWSKPGVGQVPLKGVYQRL